MIHTYTELVSSLDILFKDKKNHRRDMSLAAGSAYSADVKYNQIMDEKIPADITEFILNQYINNLPSSGPEKFHEDFHAWSIQQYNIGDYILPHADCNNWLVLQILTTSPNKLDGIVMQQDTEGSDFKFFPDVAGTLMRIKSGRLHWVNPVRDGVRYTATIAKE